MLETKEFIRLSAIKYGSQASAYARLCGMLEALIWFGSDRETVQAAIDAEVEEMKAKVNA